MRRTLRALGIMAKWIGMILAIGVGILGGLAGTTMAIAALFGVDYGTGLALSLATLLTVFGLVCMFANAYEQAGE